MLLVRAIGFGANIYSSISSFFEPKREIKSDSSIMGVPVWTVALGVGVFVSWTIKKTFELEKKALEIETRHAEIVRYADKMHELMMGFLKNDREKQELRQRIAELTQ